LNGDQTDHCWDNVRRCLGPRHLGPTRDGQVVHRDRADRDTRVRQRAHEARGRAELVDEWFALLDAPYKEIVLLDTSGHRPLFEQPDAFQEFMVGTVIAST